MIAAIVAIVVTVASAVVAPATAPAPATTAQMLYDVCFTRPGDLRRQHLAINVGFRRDWTVRRGERIVSQTKAEFTLEFEGGFETRQADGGRATKVAMRVDRFERISGIERHEVLPRGKTILIQRDGKTIQYALEDGALPPTAERFVRMLRGVPRAGEPSSDEIYGPPSRLPQPIGASWPIDGKQYATMAALSDVRVDPDDIDGNVRLVGLSKSQGSPCLQVECQMSADHVNVRPTAASRQTSGEVRESFALLVPNDPNLPIQASSSAWEGTYRFVRHVGEDEIREEAEDHIVRLREVKSRLEP
jgi:hypothetical protein